MSFGLNRAEVIGRLGADVSRRTAERKLERMLQEDRAELERIRRELAEGKTRQKDRRQDRGFSW